MRYIPDDNLSYPVLIELTNTSGSGFLLRYENECYLITAKHVLFKGSSLISDKALLTSYVKDLSKTEPIIHELDLIKLNSGGFVKCHLKFDIVIVKIASLEAKGGHYEMNPTEGVKHLSGPNDVLVAVPVASFKKFNDVLISNEAMIFGYPNSLGTNGQIDYKRPLLRKGIVAGKNIFNKTIILDCPVYFGNSGGLAMEIEEDQKGKRKFYCIGVVSQYIPFVEQLISLQHSNVNTNIENSGYSVVVPIDTINELL